MLTKQSHLWLVPPPDAPIGDTWPYIYEIEPVFKRVSSMGVDSAPTGSLYIWPYFYDTGEPAWRDHSDGYDLAYSNSKPKRINSQTMPPARAWEFVKDKLAKGYIVEDETPKICFETPKICL